jgi:hypothetical protein
MQPLTHSSSERRGRWINASDRIIDPRLLPSWAQGHDQPQFYVELDDGTEGLSGPMGTVTEDRSFRGGKQWEGHSKSGLVVTLELLPIEEAPRCEARKVECYWACALMPNHDGPHMPITKELDDKAPKGLRYIVTSLGRHG